MEVNSAIIYEQPLNEQVRTCLRIEHLLQQFHFTESGNTQWHTRNAMAALLKILNILDRPDLKPKLTQALSQHATALSALETIPHVHKEKLNAVLNELDLTIDALHQFKGKFGEKLRQNEFLNHIRMHINNPAGACDYATPDYALWLKCPIETRNQQLKHWFSDLNLLVDVVNLHLRITRSSTPFQTLTAAHGFYHQSMDATSPALLLRIRMHHLLHCYPETSVGKHRIAIRFLQMKNFTRGESQQIDTDIQFDIACCKI